MKTISGFRYGLLILLLPLLLPRLGHSQGAIIFNNFEPGLSPVTIETLPGRFNPSDGMPGAFVGSNYTASLFFVTGTVTNALLFESSNPIWVADTHFSGTTGTGPGHGFGGDESGFFDGGSHRLNGVGLELTFRVRAWYNGDGLYASYEEARAAGHNVGDSNLLPLRLSAPPGPARNLDGLLSFTVGIPEPSTFLLAALGVAALLVFRRRK